MDIPALARSVLSKEEDAVLIASEPALRRKLFYRAWVCKEALLKACGAGLSIPADRVTVLERACADNACASLVELEGRAWAVRLLDPGMEDYFAAVAQEA